MGEFIEALNAEGCAATLPRYPLLHLQPFFTEGAFTDVMRPDHRGKVPDYSSVSLPATEKANAGLMKLPSFPWASKELLDQYLYAFEKVVKNAGDIARRHGKRA
jgi:dTDP-4-amino-4,6-dideoxygalactose transaminase